MKKKFLTLFLLCLAWQGMAQFVPQPLTYPGSGYWTFFISAADPQHVWVGPISEFGDPCSFIARTENGGSSWHLDTVPVTGEPVCGSVSSVDSNTCYYLFIDNNLGEGSVWKTTDAAASWINTTTDQFAGGFANGIFAFSADTVVAMGDPTQGYWEIQRTNDGGDTWERVPATDIPDPLSGETGSYGCYSASGNSVWFSTTKGRCFRSNDKGSHWEEAQAVPGGSGNFNLCFSNELTGVFWKMDAEISEIYVTNDGGITWNTQNFPSGYSIGGMCSVPGFDNWFVVTGFQSGLDIFFTPDLFATMITLASSIISTGTVAFLDPATGWLAGGESGNNEILKWNGVLSAPEIENANPESLLILPNPSFDETLIRLPDISGLRITELRIVDLSGKLVKQIRLSNEKWTKLDAKELQNGVYQLEVISNDRVITSSKWIVNH